MRVLVTGGAGFVGRHLCQALHSDGHEVTAGVTGTQSDQVMPTGISCIPLDIMRSEQIEAALDSFQPGWIFHLAALTFAPDTLRTPLEAYRINFTGSLLLLEGVRQNCPKARVVFVSSSEVYGRPTYLPIDEDHRIAPAGPYAGSKAAAELLCWQYAESYDSDIVCVRPFNHIGPGQSDQFLVSGLARQIAEIERGLREPILMLGNLDSRRDFTDVRDVARAYIAAAKHGRSADIYNVCSGKSFSVRELVTWLIELSSLGLSETGATNAVASPIRFEQDPTRVRSGEIDEIRGCNALAREILGWNPQIDIRITLRDCLQWWRSKLMIE